MVFIYEEKEAFKLKRVTAPAPVCARAAGVGGRVLGGRRKAKCLAEEVRGIPKTNKRRMKYTGIAKCDFVAVAKCSGWLSAFLRGNGEGKLLRNVSGQDISPAELGGNRFL